MQADLSAKGQIWSLYMRCGFFANLARFDNSVKNLMKNSLILMIRFPGTTVLIFFALIFACVITYLIPIAGFLMPVIAAWLFSAPIEHVFSKCMK